VAGKPSVEDIRGSLAFRNICEALNQVFGSAWSVGTIWPDVTGNDFVASIDIRGFSAVAYASAADTHTEGMYAFGPGGTVGICVPTPMIRVSRAPDGVWISGVEEVVGTDEENATFRFGASGDRVDEIAAYLRVLKRYLGPCVGPVEPRGSDID